jgi:hypothetical protein
MGVCLSHDIEDHMTPVSSAEYQAAIEEAANAFMKVMALRGFSVRDYPQNFVAQMAQQTRLHFESSRAGAHPAADELVADFLCAGQNAARKPRAARTIAFPMLQRRAA